MNVFGKTEKGGDSFFGGAAGSSSNSGGFFSSSTATTGDSNKGGISTMLGVGGSSNEGSSGGFFGAKKQSIFGNAGGNSTTLGAALLPEAFQDEPACAKICPKLTYKQRVIGFFGCAGTGYLLSLLGTLMLIGGPSAYNIRAFAVLYVIGNVIALAATGFLLGPRSHCRKMWLPKRRYTSAFYLSMLIVVFAVAVAKQNVFLVLFLLCIEICAGIWYALSYIPFGRKALLAILRRLGICMPCFFVYDSIKAGRQAQGGGSGSQGGGSGSQGGGSSFPTFTLSSGTGNPATGSASI